MSGFDALLVKFMYTNQVLRKQVGLGWADCSIMVTSFKVLYLSLSQIYPNFC